MISNKLDKQDFLELNIKDEQNKFKFVSIVQLFVCINVSFHVMINTHAYLQELL